jgi:hypothetical protein
VQPDFLTVDPDGVASMTEVTPLKSACAGVTNISKAAATASISRHPHELRAITPAASDPPDPPSVGFPYKPEACIAIQGSGCFDKSQRQRREAMSAKKVTSTLWLLRQSGR